jgi:hypothetical protein
MSINEEDVYILVRSNLEMKFMNQLMELMWKRIAENGQKPTTALNKILQPFGTSYSCQSNEVQRNSQKLNENFMTQYNQYMVRYPDRPRNIRFTQQEIDNYFPNTVSIVKNYVETNQIEAWIFDKHELYEGMYDELTRCIWMDIFQCGEEIFEPLEKLDSRFKLEDQYKDDVVFSGKMKKNAGSVMKALEGQVKLDHHVQKVTPFKHNLLSRELTIESLGQIFDLWARNSI